MKNSDNKTSVENVEVKNENEKRWEPLEGRGGFFEICYETGEVRFKDSKKIVKNLRWNNEERAIKEYRTREYNPMEEDVREAGRVYVGSKGDYLEWDYDNESCVLRKAKDKEEPEVEPEKKEYTYSELMEIVEMYVEEALEQKGMIVVHRNGDKMNNRVDNLKYVDFHELKYYYTKPVEMRDPETGELLKIYPNVATAAEENDIDPEGIYLASLGRADEYNEEREEEEDYDE